MDFNFKMFPKKIGCNAIGTPVSEDLLTNLQRYGWDKLKICQGSRCNYKQYFPKCLVCNSTKDFDCAENPNPSHSKGCSEYSNQCFTMVSGNDTVRGCLQDLDEHMQKQCTENQKYCKYYPTTDRVGLNNVETVDVCVECDSSADGRCRLNPQHFEGKICDELPSINGKGCYLSIVSNIYFKHFPIIFISII